MSRASTGLNASLAVLIAALLMVGVVGHTPLRHSIQVAPVVLVLLAGLTGREWARSAAAAVCAFWLFIMSLIWLFLLGVARVITGTFTSVEVVLTILIGAAAAAGLGIAFRAPDSARWPIRIFSFIFAAAFQIGAMWLSLQPSFSRR